MNWLRFSNARQTALWQRHPLKISRRFYAVAGDGDHGRSMLSGARAAAQVAARAEEVGADLPAALAAAADAWCDASGGTSGGRKL